MEEEELDGAVSAVSAASCGGSLRWFLREAGRGGAQSTGRRSAGWVVMAVLMAVLMAAMAVMAVIAVVWSYVQSTEAR